MPNSVDRTRIAANSVSVVCTELKTVLAKIDVLLEANSDLSIDWGGDPLPAYISEDADGNIDGLQFGRAQISNALFSLDQVRNVLTNQAVTQGDHLGNINQVAQVMPLR